MTDRFEDDRGVIQDMLGPVDSVTHITTRTGCVRGNHVHERTTQWTLVVDGSLMMASGKHKTLMRRGQMMKHDPGDPHAWKAIDDCACLVFAKGPRSGDQYETDTVRLDEPLLS